MATYLGYTVQMKTLFRGWPVMVHDTHTRRRSSKCFHERSIWLQKTSFASVCDDV